MAPNKETFLSESTLSRSLDLQSNTLRFKTEWSSAKPQCYGYIDQCILSDNPYSVKDIQMITKSRCPYLFQ